MNANISGLSIRYDVPSKCTIVATVLSTRFKTRKDQNEFISGLAKDIQVNPVTIKMWCSKYSATYNLGKQLPVGTMSHSFLTIPQVAIPEVNISLNTLKHSLNALKEFQEIPNIKGYSADSLRSRSTPQELLNELIEATKGS